MNIKNFAMLLLVAIILVSCTPAATVAPTETIIPTLTFTPVPTATASITPTPAPENLADAKDLSKWIEDYVYAFDGKVIIDGAEMNADQLTEQIRKSAEAFTQEQEINGVEYLFLLVNDIPLAMRVGKGRWEQLTSKKIIELYRKPDDTYKYFGVQFSNPFSNDTSEKVDDVFGGEFNAAFLNDGVWHTIEQQEGHPDFSNFLDAADKARARDMFILGGQLVDPRGEFDYTYLKDKQGLTGELLLEIMKRHIIDQTTVAKGKVDAYVVVNESRPASATIDGGPEDPFNVIIGEDYIREAFQTARDTDPQAILIYNDGANHQSPRNPYGWNTERTLEIIRRLNPEGQERGLIDAIGVQLHLMAKNPPNIEDLIKTLKNYGLPIYVTELEISTYGVSGTELEKEQLQEKLYQNVLTALLQTDVVVMVSHWHAIDTWDGEQGQLFDNQLRPTRNLYIERKVLFGYYQNR